jgi:hypothetical protein
MDTLNPRIQPADPTAAAYRHLFLTLRDAMPQASDSPQAGQLRDQAAIAQVAGLCPANVAEAALAAQYVAANAHALAALALSHHPDLSPALAARSHACANSMMRRAQGALALLVRMQAQRVRRDADATSANHAAWAEHCVSEWMGAPDLGQCAADQDTATPVTQPEPPPPQDQPPLRVTAPRHSYQGMTQTIIARVPETPSAQTMPHHPVKERGSGRVAAGGTRSHPSKH